MKTLLFFTGFLLALSPVVAQQTFNRAYQNAIEIPNPFLLNCNNDLYFSAKTYIPHGAGTIVYRHDKNGKNKFTVGLPSGQVSYAMISKDNKLIFSGHSYMCDVIPPDQQNFITKMDTNGVILFTSTYTVNGQDKIKACVQLQDSSFFSFTDSTLIKHSKSGQFISKTNLGINSISSALLLPNNTVLLSARSGNQNALLTINSALALVQVNSTSVLLKKLSYYGSQSIIGLGTDAKLYKFTQSFNLLGSSVFSSGLSVSDFVSKNDTIYSVLYSASGIANYAVTDTSFATISLTSTTTHSLSQIAICMNGTKIAILSACLSSNNLWSSSYSHYFSSLSSIDKLASHNFASDLALVSVLPDSAYSSCYFTNFPAPLGQYICSSYLRVKVKVKNKGGTEITNFELNCFDSPAVDCGASFYKEQFSGLSLMPGDSIELTGNLFARKGYGYQGSAPSFSTNFCFYVSLPNDETDKTIEDNEICGTFNFLATSIKKYDLQSFNLKVFPNPLENNLNLESDVRIKNIEVMNALGATIANKVVNSTKSELNTSDWTSGVYFLKIETEQGIATRKIVKQ